MTDSEALLERAPEHDPPPPAPPWQTFPQSLLPPLPEPLGGPLLWTLLALTAVTFDLALRVGTATLAGTLTVLGLTGIVVSQRGRRLAPLNLGAISLAVLLGSSLMLRTSPWVTGPALLASACLVFLVATDQLRDGVRPWITGLIGGVIGSVTAVRWSHRIIGRADRPNGFSGVAIVRSAGLVSVVAATLLALLASGDAVFANVLATLNLSAGFGHLVGISVGLGGGLVTAFVTLTDRTAAHPTDGVAARFPLESNAIMVTIASVLGAWSALQVSVALGAADRILETEGLTVAAYAREGFFQLVAVAAIVLSAVSLAGRVSRLPRLREGRVFRFAATAIGLEMLLLIVASFTRLGFYIDEFGLTMLRLSVAWFLAWLAFFSLVVVARAMGSSWADRWSHTISVLSLGFAVLAFAVANPESLVVRHNLATAEPDLDYLAGLSGDGISAVQATADPEAAAVVSERYCSERQSVGYGVLSWNLGKAHCPDT